MKLASFEAIARAMENAGVRYLVAGGLAVAAHGYRPAVPVTAEQFADAATREGWIRDKHMQVLQFWSDSHRETPVDIFVSDPFPFDAEYDRALVKPLTGAIPVRFVTLPTLIAMKQAATARRTALTSNT